jgi:hypothetical protein
MPKRATPSTPGEGSAVPARAFRDLLRRSYALLDEFDEVHKAYVSLLDTVGPARAHALASEEARRWQRRTGRCAVCRVALDDHE